MFDRYRLIASIVVLLIYLFFMFPAQTVVTAIVLFVAYFVIRNLNRNNVETNSKTARRQNSLKAAKIYLAPYSDIWRNLKLSNKYCSLSLGSDGQSITARSSTCADCSFKVVHSKVHSYDDLWDMLCIYFDHNTTFEGLIQLCRTFQVDIKLSDTRNINYNATVHSKNNLHQSENVIQDSNVIKTDLPKEILDVNNASEVELTALPGVSIVMAKKLIKKREEIGGFKSVDDVCLFLHLKPHMQNQLKSLICVKKMNGVKQAKRYEERSIDL